VLPTSRNHKLAHKELGNIMVVKIDKSINHAHIVNIVIGSGLVIISDLNKKFDPLGNLSTQAEADPAQLEILLVVPGPICLCIGATEKLGLEPKAQLQAGIFVDFYLHSGPARHGQSNKDYNE
jgi:hypothetical protein